MTEAIESEGIRARLAAQRVRARLALVPSTPLARRIVASLQRDQTPKLRHFYRVRTLTVATPKLRQLPLRCMWRTYNMLLYSRQPSRRGVACYRYPCPPYCHHRRGLARRVGDAANHDPPVSRLARLTTRPSLLERAWIPGGPPGEPGVNHLAAPNRCICIGLQLLPCPAAL